MKTQAEKLIDKYLNFGGDKNAKDFEIFFREIMLAQIQDRTPHDFKLLVYLQHKITHGLQLALKHGTIYVMVDEESIEDIEDAIEDNELDGVNEKKEVPKNTKAPKKKAKVAKKSKGEDLGKLVDHGAEIPGSKADGYWGRKDRLDVIFLPNDEQVRKGERIPTEYKYTDVRYLEKYYGLRAFEFGRWLSQQDCFNYLSGLGLGLYDLHKLLKFEPSQMSLKGKLVVAFGARGRGRATAHFEPSTFAINLTRYSRPDKLSARPKNFRRVNLILQGGGVGAFAHEFAHALDVYAGTFITKADNFQISGGRDTDPAQRLPSAKKNKIVGAMDNLLNKIIWKSKNIQSDYYKRLTKGAVREYFIRRNEIWARSFEVYVQFKLEKHHHKNVFLNDSKYPAKFYLTLPEMKKLEPDFDALIVEFKKHL